MKFSQLLLSIVIIFSGISFSQNNLPNQSDTTLYAGCRVSRILNSYPNREFPSAEYWSSTTRAMAENFTGAQPCAVWIVSLYIGDGITQVNFPYPGHSLNKVHFLSKDYNEEYLDKFDQDGINVWLQVESGGADVDTLISIVLNKYKHHPCVKGFGVDGEWYYTHTHSGGRPITNSEAKRWDEKVQSIDSTYSLFLKHYGTKWMPTSYRGNILFVDDSQMFTSFSQMLNEFKGWGRKFAPNKVAFQIGYPKDKEWWVNYKNPPQYLGQKLLDGVPNCNMILWVDFTINDVFPITSIQNEPFHQNPSKPTLRNFPNPFNNSTMFEYTLVDQSNIIFRVYSILGECVYEKEISNLPAGRHRLQLNAQHLSSGIYFALLEINGVTHEKELLTNQILLVR